MSPRGSRPRTLLVGPVGQRPWISRNELIAQLDDVGHDVLVNGVGGPELVPALEPLPSRVGVVRNSLPSLGLWSARMLWRWRREAQARLAEAAIDNIVVWDPVHAGLCRLARPEGTEVVWVPSHAESTRFYESVVRALLSMTADRVVVSAPDDARWVRGRVTLSAWPSPAPSGRQRLDAWVVLASEVAPDEDAFARLARDAADHPAAAVIFDARDDDRVPPALAERLRAASGAPHAWWAAGDEWLDWLGGAPAFAVDPSRRVAVDQRHLRVLAEGGALRAGHDAIAAKSAGLLIAVKEADGWTEYALGDARTPTDESVWVDTAFGAAATPAPVHLAAGAVALAECPLCGATERRLAGRTEGATSVLQCRSCGLRYASHVVPGTAHKEDAPVDRVERMLNVLDETGLTPGRLVRVGVDASDFAARATERGWDASDATLDDLADHRGEPVDVVVFDRTLEAAADPVGVLRLVRSHVIGRGGRVVIQTPNARSVSRYLQGAHWAQWRAGERVSYPDLWTVRQLLQRSGYQTQLLRTESCPDAPVAGAQLAHELGFVSTRLARVAPPLADALDRRVADASIRRTARWIDKRGLGLNVIAVGRAI